MCDNPLREIVTVNFYTDGAGHKYPHFERSLLRFSRVESVTPAQNVDLHNGPMVMVRTTSGDILMCKGTVEDFKNDQA